MNEYVEVPVKAAQDISTNFNKSIVVIVCYDPKHEKTHITTFGVSASDKENAVDAGDKFAKVVGADMGSKHVHEDFHTDYSPALYKEFILDRLHAGVTTKGYKCADCTMDNEPCPTCYAAGYKKKHPNTHFHSI